MKQFDNLEIQKNIEEKRLILAGKVDNFLSKKLSIITDFFVRIFAAKYCALIGSILIIAISILCRSTHDIGHDNGLYLSIANKLLNGGKYYQDFFEINLPLVFCITTIPVFLAKIFAINPIISLEIFVNLVGILTIYCSSKILFRFDFAKDRTIFNILILSVAVGFFLRIFTLQIGDFGTKSTYFLSAAFPYIFYHFLKESQLKKSDQIIIGFLGALLFCIKPNYGILVIAFELKKILENKSLKSVFSLRNYVSFSFIVVYLLILIACFPEYIKGLPSFLAIYLNIKSINISLALKEDLFPLVFLVFLCLFLVKKFAFLKQLTCAFAALIIIEIFEITEFYDQRSAIFALSMPLVFSISLCLIRDHQINWKRDWFFLLLILIGPQFDRSYFSSMAFNCGAFWWLFVLIISAKWRNILAQKNLTQNNFLGYFFLPKDIISWLCFLSLTAATLYFGSNPKINNQVWIITAIIFILLTDFYHKLYQKFFSSQKLPILSSCIIFTILSYIISLEIAAISGAYEYQSPNQTTKQMRKVIKNNLALDEDFAVISSVILGTFPIVNYVNKENVLPTSSLYSLFKKIEDRKPFSPEQNYLFQRLKDQLQNPKNQLIFVDIKGNIDDKNCRIGFLEYYFYDEEFRKIFLENYTFLTRIIEVKPAERKIKFFSDKGQKVIALSAGDTLTRDIEVYVRKD